LHIFNRVEDILKEDATLELFFAEYQIPGICAVQLTYNFTSLDEILDTGFKNLGEASSEKEIKPIFRHIDTHLPSPLSGFSYARNAPLFSRQQEELPTPSYISLD
jgi:hypothetical protein